LCRVLLAAPWKEDIHAIEAQLRAGIFLITLHCNPHDEYDIKEVTPKIDTLEKSSTSLLWKAFNTEPGGQLIIGAGKAFKKQMERDSIIVKKVADSVKSCQAAVPQAAEFFSGGDVCLPGSRRLTDICASAEGVEDSRGQGFEVCAPAD